MSRSVGILGTGPARAAIESALVDVDIEKRSIAPDAVDDVDLTVVVGPAGTDPIHAVNRRADRWIAVEIGGVGGVAVPEVDGAVTAFGPETGCYACLGTRVRSNLASEANVRPTAETADVRLLGAIAGRTAVAVLAGEPDVLGTVTELPHAQRELLPVPGCGCDSGSSLNRDPVKTTADRSLDAVATAMERAVDPRVGIVREIGETDSFPAPYYLATLCDTTGFSDVRVPDQAAGVAADWDRAFVKAAGEALERYAGGLYREADFRTAPAATLGNAVPPSAFVRPDEGYAPPDPDEAIPWVRGSSLTTGDPVSLPAEFVVFPPPTERHRPAITTGLGLGSSGVEALLAGLYEVVERDATMLAWYSTFEPMSLETDDAVVTTLRKRARAEDLSLDLALLTQDVDIPVVAAAVHRDGDWPQFGAGSAASLDPDRAARSAVSEALQNWMELRAMGPDRAAEQEGWIGRYGTRPGAAREFITAETAVHVDALRPDSIPTGGDELAAVLERLTAVDLDAYASRLTTRDLADLGFEASRVLVPAAQPLFVDQRYFGDRARTVPRSLGYRPRLDREPHPFP